MWNKIKSISKWWPIILALLALSGSVALWLKQNRDRITGLKRAVLARDSMILVRDGLYTKLVDDTKKEKDLRKKLEEQYQDIYKIVKRLEEKPGQIIETVITAPSKKDTITLRDTIIQDIAYPMFRDYYPSKENYFIEHTSIIGKDVAEGYWSFTDIPLGIIITQEKTGMWKSYLDGPDWLTVSSLEVNSLPIKSVTFDPPKIEWLGGGGAGFGFDKEFYFLGSFGAKFQKNILLGSINTDKDIEFQYLRVF
jgi:hypothetical protein